MLNSRLGLCAATPSPLPPRGWLPTGAPLLPKLRGQLAEFLDEGSLAHLSALTLTHQCRFAVRAQIVSPTGFSRPLRLVLVALTEVAASLRPLSSLRRPLPKNAPCPIGARGVPHGVLVASPTTCGAGILTSCPSPTPCGLGLGPPNPPRMTLPEEPSGFRWADFSSAFTLLMPAFALPTTPPGLPTRLQR